MHLSVSTSALRWVRPTLQRMPPLDQLLERPGDQAPLGTSDWAAPAGPAIAESAARTSAGTWAVRVLIAQARRALVMMRLEEAVKATGQLDRKSVV